MDPRKGRHCKFKFVGNRKKLGDVSAVRKFLELVVPAVGMQALAEPIMFDIPIVLEKANLSCAEDEGGVTGVASGAVRSVISGTAVLSTSHAAMHTWPEHSYAVFDLYSCRDFSLLVVTALLTEHFDIGIGDMQVHDFSYALDFHKPLL
jgi:hypothetical protein